MNIHQLSKQVAVAGIKHVVVTAAIKTEVAYHWFKFNNSRALNITHGNGKTTVRLEKGDIYGLRPSSSGKKFRLVTRKTGLTKVFTIPETVYKSLVVKGTITKPKKVPYKVAASGSSTFEDVKAAIAEFKEAVTTIAKSHDAKAVNTARIRLGDLALGVKNKAYGMPEEMHAEKPTPEMLAVAKTYNSMAQALFPKPTLSEISDRYKRKFYTQQSTFRAMGIQASKNIAASKTVEELLSNIVFATLDLMRHEDQLVEIAGENT